VDFELLPEPSEEGQAVISALRLKVGDLEILDNVPTSSWNKFVTYWHGGDKRKRETASAMVDLEVLNVKPMQSLSASELAIKVCSSYDFLMVGESIAPETACGSGYIGLHHPFLRVQRRNGATWQRNSP